MAAAFSNVPQGNLNFRTNAIYAITPAMIAKGMSFPTALPVEQVRKPGRSPLPFFKPVLPLAIIWCDSEASCPGTRGYEAALHWRVCITLELLLLVRKRVHITVDTDSLPLRR